MEITVTRAPSLKGATLGEMCVNGTHECYTLEDEVREKSNPGVWRTMDEYVASWKIPKVTAIPRGRYHVTVTFSPHFNRLLPLINDVPGYTGVRIHPGNKAADTDGCILVGQTKESNLVYQSKAAFDVLFPKIQAAIARGEQVFISIA